MKFTPINMDEYIRHEHFEHYFNNIPCTYSVCVKLDISKLKETERKIYPVMIHGISKIVNQHNEFRMACDADGIVGVFDTLYPCYTVFHKDTETFSNIWTKYSEDYEEFEKNYNHDMTAYGECHAFEAKPDTPENTFPISMIPWTSFEGFNLNLQMGYNYLLPIFTMGKYYQQDGRILMPLAIQVHHAVCDGFHVSRLVKELQILLNR